MMDKQLAKPGGFLEEIRVESAPVGGSIKKLVEWVLNLRKSGSWGWGNVEHSPSPSFLPSFLPSFPPPFFFGRTGV
jgi:hypothetical protein